MCPFELPVLFAGFVLFAFFAFVIYSMMTDPNRTHANVATHTANLGSTLKCSSSLMFSYIFGFRLFDH